MDTQNQTPEWMKDEALQKLDPRKLNLLIKMDNATKGKKFKNQNDVLRSLLPILKEAKEEKLTFSPAELQLMITILQKHSSDKERDQMNQILEKTKEAGMEIKIPTP